MFRADMDLIQSLVKCLSGVEVAVFDGKDSLIRSFCSHYSQDLYFPDLERAVISEFDRLQPDCVYEISGLFFLHYILAYDKTEEHYLLAGPCLLEKPPEQELRIKIRELELSPQAAENVLRYLNRAPVIAYETYHQLGDLLTRSVTNSHGPLPCLRVNHNLKAKQRSSLLLLDQFAELSQIRMVELRYENSAALTEAVKCGNLSLAYRFLQEMHSEADSISRNPDPLRNRKNLCIVLNTQLRYALEEVGVHPFLLDNVSGAIGQRIESQYSLEECSRLAADVVRQYCELAQDHSYPSLSPFIHLTVTYIKSHLTENITVKDTARSLLVNPDYLSHKFHQEMGITFIDFINRERTAQAAALLSRTTLQIQQISSAVGYNNTSYFARQFSKFYHMTPRDYRGKN